MPNIASDIAEKTELTLEVINGDKLRFEFDVGSRRVVIRKSALNMI